MMTVASEGDDAEEAQFIESALASMEHPRVSTIRRHFGLANLLIIMLKEYLQ
jgi:hypothetical protein